MSTAGAHPIERPRQPLLRVEYDHLGRPIRVYIGALDVTHLVARVQTNTTHHGTTTEVVLTARDSHAPTLETKA